MTHQAKLKMKKHRQSYHVITFLCLLFFGECHATEVNNQDKLLYTQRISPHPHQPPPIIAPDIVKPSSWPVNPPPAETTLTTTISSRAQLSNFPKLNLTSLTNKTDVATDSDIVPALISVSHDKTNHQDVSPSSIHHNQHYDLNHTSTTPSSNLALSTQSELERLSRARQTTQLSIQREQQSSKQQRQQQQRQQNESFNTGFSVAQLSNSNTNNDELIESTDSTTLDSNPSTSTGFPFNYSQLSTTEGRTELTTSQIHTVHPLLIYSIRYEIKSYDLYNLNAAQSSKSSSSSVSSNSNSAQVAFYDNNHHVGRNPKTLIAGLKNTIGLDFYYSDQESYIFWTDVIEERIYKGTIKNGTLTNAEMVIQTGLATAEGLAVDWIGHNIYWVESALDHIEVATLDGNHRRTLIAGDMESPRAIALDPRYGYMFWTDWDKKQPRIERATMSGDDRRIIVSIKELNGAWPNGLTLDYEMLKIYWIDANSDSIHVVDYHGNNHQLLVRHLKSLGHPFSITLFENNLFWTDWKTNSVSMFSKHNGSDAKEIHRLPASRLFDIKVFHPSRQPKLENGSNPCLDNGGCSHLCLLSTNHTRKCLCPHLMKLSKNSLTCETDENFLLMGKTNEIRAVDLDSTLYHIMSPIGIPKVFNPKQFDFYAKSKTIFWVDSHTNDVKRANLLGNGIDTILDVIIESPGGLALDWISGNIYVTSSTQQRAGKILISNLNGEYISTLMDHTSGIISPKSIVVHPILGLLFCVDENESSEPVIFASGMDGKNKNIIVDRLNNPKLENPVSLSIDYELNRIYWINQVTNSSNHNSIQYYDIKDGKIETIFNNSTEVSFRMNPEVLCLDNENLIMSGKEGQTQTIVKIDKNNLHNVTILTENIQEPLTTMRVYNASSQTGTNACSTNNGGCSHLCAPTNSTHRACICTMGFKNNPNNETECLGKDLFLIFSYNLGMKGVSIEPNQPADDYYLAPIHRAFRASSIDFVYKENLIYWMDNEEASITSINRDTSNYHTIVQGLESEESICIDWVAENIYWLDPYYDLIEVARLNGTNRYVIISGDMDKANGIAINPIKGYIVWSDVGSFPKIETAQLDGSNRRIVVNINLTHIDDLAIDYNDDYIYWVDSTLAIIERIRQDGNGRQVVYAGNSNQGTHNHLVAIAIYRDYLFFADSAQHQGSIIRCNKNNVTEKHILQQALGDGIKDIAIFAEQSIPSVEENPCVEKNGGCQDLCLFMGRKGEKRCICSHGRLKQDGLSCEPYDIFVFYSKLSQIDSLHIKDDELASNSPYAPITIENRSNIISLTVDYNSNRVIYSEMTRDQICSVFFNGTDRRVLADKQSLVEGIAFSDDQLFWTSIHDNSITKLNTTSSGTRKRTCINDSCTTAGIEKIIRLTSDDKPRGIAIDSCTSYIYWTNWNTNASIQRASPYNGYKVESIIKTNIKVPNGIAIDQKLRKLYWCDARLDKIESCDMDGTHRVVLVSAAPQHPFALAIWDNYVFWTDWLARGVFRADKHTGEHSTQIKKVVQRPMGIAVVAPENLECPNDPCAINNGGCTDDSVCKVVHYLSESKVVCLPLKASHDLHLPAHVCNHTIKGSCKLDNYHNVIMNVMDRYNVTPMPETQNSEYPDLPLLTSTESVTEKPNSMLDIRPKSGLEPRRMNTDQTTSISSSSSSSTISSAERKRLNPKPQTSVSEGTTKSMSSVATKSTKPNSTRELISETTIISTPVSSTPPPSVDRPFSSTITSTFAPTSIPATTKAQPNDSIESQTTPNTTTTNILPTQAPLTNTTLAPCQIDPTAMHTIMEQSTNNDCKLPGQYKCYLSDKLVCIPGEQRCDGNQDCPHKEDENDCHLSKRGGSYSLKRDSNWHRYVTVILIILGAAVAAMFLVFGTRGRRRWFVVGSNGAFNHRRMFDDNGTNIEISNPMFDEDDTGNMVHCAFSIDLNERTTNFSNPLYERQFLLMNDKHVTSN